MNNPSQLFAMKSEFQEEKIQCPHCEWHPDGQPWWACTKCNHLWNTFDTYARCPACGHQHDDTQCPHCDKVSPHEDWYIGLNGLVEELIEESLLVEKI